MILYSQTSTMIRVEIAFPNKGYSDKLETLLCNSNTPVSHCFQWVCGICVYVHVLFLLGEQEKGRVLLIWKREERRLRNHNRRIEQGN